MISKKSNIDNSNSDFSKKLFLSEGDVDLNHIFYCNDDNKKIFKIKFDSGMLGKDDTWFLCEPCSLKPEFQKCRITTDKCSVDISNELS